jgi:hypothetical protein
MMLEQVVTAVAALSGVSSSELCRPRGYRRIQRIRDCAMWCARQLTDCSYPEIAKFFGHKGHKSVMDACQRYEAWEWRTVRIRMLLRVGCWPAQYELPSMDELVRFERQQAAE